MKILRLIVFILLPVLFLQANSYADDLALQRRMEKLRRKLQRLSDKNTARQNKQNNEQNDSEDGSDSTQGFDTSSILPQGAATNLPGNDSLLKDVDFAPPNMVTGQSLSNMPMASAAQAMPGQMPITGGASQMPRGSIINDGSAPESAYNPEPSVDIGKKSASFEGSVEQGAERDDDGNIIKKTTKKKGQERLIDDSVLDDSETLITEDGMIQETKKKGKVTNNDMEADVNFQEVRNADGTQMTNKKVVNWSYSSDKKDDEEEEDY